MHTLHNVLEIQHIKPLTKIVCVIIPTRCTSSDVGLKMTDIRQIQVSPGLRDSIVMNNTDDHLNQVSHH